MTESEAFRPKSTHVGLKGTMKSNLCVDQHSEQALRWDRTPSNIYDNNLVRGSLRAIDAFKI